MGILWCLNAVSHTLKTFVTSSRKWLITFIEMLPDLGFLERT
jgi:hypothetical protein